MEEDNTGAKAELLPPNKLEVLRRLAWLSMLALAVPFIAILIPSVVVAFLRPEPEVMSALVNLSWVLVIFCGFAFLVVSLFSAAVLFRVFNMHDKAHSLGLPRNSIRSLLTFLVFLILMAFIFYSTQVVATQNSTGIALIPLSDLQGTVATLGLSEKMIGYEVIEEGGTQVARVTFLVEEESAAMQYFDRILVALLGISSTIVGFYFGSRSQETSAARPDEKILDEDETAAGARPTETGTADETDSLEWSVVSQVLKLAPAKDGGLTGVVMVNPSDPEGDREFGARFVPTEDHDTAIDKASVDVTRLADRLTLHVTGVDPAKLKDIGENLEMSVYYRDEEEQAKTLPVEFGETVS
jgi:hypothetical protein